MFSSLLRIVRAPHTATHLKTGRVGERLAAHYLRTIGYRILGCNVHLGKDEIDIVAFDPCDQVVVFCEVKTRAKDHPDFAPELNITFRKREHLRRSARRWVARNGYRGGYRIDLLAVVDQEIVRHCAQLSWEG